MTIEIEKNEVVTFLCIVHGMTDINILYYFNIERLNKVNQCNIELDIEHICNTVRISV